MISIDHVAQNISVSSKKPALFDPKDIDNIDQVLARQLDVKIPKKETPSRTSSPAPVQQPKPRATQEISLDASTRTLNSPHHILTQSEADLLFTNGITTIAQFIQLTEQDFESMKSPKIRANKAQYLAAQAQIKEKLGIC